MKITMYELLGMVKDGKAPKKIKYNTFELKRTMSNNLLRLYVDEDGMFFPEYYSGLTLNDKVEIIEEEKKIPDEININLAYIDKEYLLDKEDVDRKINEIINKHNILVDKVSDYLKSKGE